MHRFSMVVLRNSIFAAGGQVAIKLLSLAFSVAVVRHLGADSFGQYSAVLAFGAIFVFLGDLGLSLYSVRQVATWREARGGAERIGRLYGHLLGLRLVLSILAAGLMISSAVATGRPPAMVGAIALGSSGLIMYSFQGASDAVLMGLERLDISAAAKVANQAVFVLAGSLALWLGFGYYGLVVASLLGVALMTRLCWRAVRKLGVRASLPDVYKWGGLLRASVPFGVIGFTLGLSYKFDSVLLNIYRGDAETGYYSAAYNLVFSAAMLSNAFNVALYPSLARRASSGPGDLPRIYERALGYLMMLALPITAGGWALAGQLVPFLFTDAYLPSVPALQIVIWVVPLMFASEFLGYVVVVRGEERRVARAVVVSTGLNVSLNLLLVPSYGYLAAAVMTVVTEGVLVGQYLWLLRGLVCEFDWSRLLLRPALAASVMVTLVVTIRDGHVLIALFAGALCYAVLAVWLGLVGREEWALLAGLARRYPHAEDSLEVGRYKARVVVGASEAAGRVGQADSEVA